jgi:hypothetical protein
MSSACERLSPPQSSSTTASPRVGEIDAIAGTIVDTHFADASTNGPHVSRVVHFKAPNSDDDALARIVIAQTDEPLPEDFRLPNLGHQGLYPIRDNMSMADQSL